MIRLLRSPKPVYRLPLHHLPAPSRFHRLLSPLALRDDLLDPFVTPSLPLLSSAPALFPLADLSSARSVATITRKRRCTTRRLL